MDQDIRNKLRNVVTQCRKLLEDAIAQELEGKYGIFAKKDQVTADPNAAMSHLSDEDQASRRDILDHFAHIKARGFKPKETLDQLVREIAFTHLNRLCAYKMMEAREVYVGGQKFREAVSRGVNSNGVKFYLADHEDDERLFNTGQQDVAYRHFLDWLGGALSEEIGVLFNPNDPANRLYPRQKTLDEILDLLNGGGIKAEETELREQWPKIWAQDETIGWVYQYFTPKELRDQARKESQAPRNSYELAFRNQFFTPRYVVEFLTDNTLGRIWYEMRKGNTKLKDQCRYLVRRPDEVFLALGTSEGHECYDEGCGDCARMLLEADESSFPPFHADDDEAVQRMIELAHCVSAYEQFGKGVWAWFAPMRPLIEGERTSLAEVSTGDLLNYLFLICRGDRHSGGDGAVYRKGWFLNAANEVRRRVLSSRGEDASQEQLLKAPVFIPYRPKKDPRELKILDPACGSGHFLLYCFDLLLTIYEEAYADPRLGPALQEDYPTLEDLQRDVPRLILAHNLHGIDIDLRASQIAALALWLRCQRAYQDMGLKKDRPKITRSNFVCAESMPGEESMLKEFVGQLEPKVLGQVVEVVFDKMKLAGEAGSLLKIEEEIRDAVAEAKKQWVRETAKATDRKGQPLLFTQAALDHLDGEPKQPSLFDFSDLTDAQFFDQAETKVIEALRSYAEKAQSGQRLQKRLFTDDAVRGFAFVDLCQKRYDVVLMNPPFGDSSKPAKSLMETQYPRTKKDVYAAFVEQGLHRLHNGGMLGAITSRTGFFLSSFQQWREEILLAEAVPTVFADLGYGVLDTAMVETAAYCVEAHRGSGRTSFFRLTHSNDKATALADATAALHSGDNEPNVYHVDPASFRQVPGSPFAYWVSERIRRLFKDFLSFETDSRTVRIGMKTGDDFRFLRAWWETYPSSSCWIPYAKGGSTTSFYSHLFGKNPRLQAGKTSVLAHVKIPACFNIGPP